MDSPGRGLECVGSIPQLLKLLDRDDEASPRDHINHREDARKQPGVGEIQDSAFQLVCRDESFRQVVNGRQKDIGDLKTDGVSFVYQWGSFPGRG